MKDALTIAVFGADGYTCQIPRIKQAFLEMNHKINQKNPDIIFSNDPTGFKSAINLKNKFPKSFLILNILDIPWHFSKINLWIRDVVKQLRNADAITTISLKVKNDLEQFMNQNIYVIYNPSKDVFYNESIKKNNMFLYVGRANDPIKRIQLLYESLSKIKGTLKKIKICGSENPGFGDYLGVVSDKELNDLYNSSKYVCLPSKAEGIGLPMIEAMICGSIPITCSDNLTAKEFSPSEFISEPNSNSMVEKIKELENDYETKRDLSIKFGQKYKVQFNKKNIANNILNIFNSKLL